MWRQPGRPLALEMPEPDVLQPDRHPLFQAFEAQIGVLVMAEHEILGEAAELLEPVALGRDERPGHGGNWALAEELGAIRRRALAVVLDPQHPPPGQVAVDDGDRLVGVEIHSAMHQRTVVIIERHAE